MSIMDGIVNSAAIHGGRDKVQNTPMFYTKTCIGSWYDVEPMHDKSGGDTYTTVSYFSLLTVYSLLDKTRESKGVCIATTLVVHGFNVIP